MVTAILQSVHVPVGDEPLCVLFTNTVGSRRSQAPSEYLKTADDLKKWLVDRRLLDPSEPIDENYRARALTLRDAVYRILSNVAAGSVADDEDWETLNGELCEALAKVDLSPSLRWVLTEEDLSERALMIIALSAAELLTSPMSARVRECADDECGWLFLDLSKNRSRRWCSMSDCGNLAKARRFQARKLASKKDGA
jgi:predicted RNA-binding Zn ribbon-like protein